MTVVSSTYIDYILEGLLSLFNGIWSIILPLLCNIGLLGSSHECGSAIQDIKILWVSFQFFSKIFSPPSLHCLHLKFNFTLKSPSHATVMNLLALAYQQVTIKWYIPLGQPGGGGSNPLWPTKSMISWFWNKRGKGFFPSDQISYNTIP